MVIVGIVSSSSPSSLATGRTLLATCLPFLNTGLAERRLGHSPSRSQKRLHASDSSCATTVCDDWKIARLPSFEPLHSAVTCQRNLGFSASFRAAYAGLKHRLSSSCLASDSARRRRHIGLVILQRDDRHRRFASDFAGGILRSSCHCVFLSMKTGWFIAIGRQTMPDANLL